MPVGWGCQRVTGESCPSRSSPHLTELVVRQRRRRSPLTARTFATCVLSCCSVDLVHCSAPEPSSITAVASETGRSEQDAAAQGLPVFHVTFVVRNLAGTLPGTSSNLTVRVHPQWAPRSAKRFAQLVRAGFYNECRFYRVIKGFVAQFGISGDPRASSHMRGKLFSEDKVVVNNSRGRLAFATTGRTGRSTQVLINLKDNIELDGRGLAPFAEVVEGMEVADKLFSGYGESAPTGRGPSPTKLLLEGNTYLADKFPNLSFIEAAFFANESVILAASALGALDNDPPAQWKVRSAVLWGGLIAFGTCFAVLFLRVIQSCFKKGVYSGLEDIETEATPVASEASFVGESRRPAKKGKFSWKPPRAQSRRDQARNRDGRNPTATYGRSAQNRASE